MRRVSSSSSVVLIDVVGRPRTSTGRAGMDRGVCLRGGGGGVVVVLAVGVVAVGAGVAHEGDKVGEVVVVAASVSSSSSSLHVVSVVSMAVLVVLGGGGRGQVGVHVVRGVAHVRVVVVVAG